MWLVKTKALISCYCTADLHLCFRISKNPVFSFDKINIEIPDSCGCCRFQIKCCFLNECTLLCLTLSHNN